MHDSRSLPWARTMNGGSTLRVVVIKDDCREAIHHNIINDHLFVVRWQHLYNTMAWEGNDQPILLNGLHEMCVLPIIDPQANYEIIS